MSTLLLGGRGKTSIKIATLLAEAKVPFALASRSKSDGCKYQQVEFDWQKRNTYGIPFDTVSPPIKAIYIVMPPDGAIDPVKEFIGVARGRGVGRFVLLSSSAIEAGGPAHGQIHQYLMALGVEWAVLRPSWFMGMLNSRLEHQPLTRSQRISCSRTDSTRVKTSCIQQPVMERSLGSRPQISPLSDFDA